MNNFPEWMGEYPRDGVLWSSSEIGHLIESLKEGIWIETIAKEHGRSNYSVVLKLLSRCPQYWSYLKENTIVSKEGNKGIISIANDIMEINANLSWIFKKWDYKGNEIMPLKVPPTPYPVYKSLLYTEDSICEATCSILAVLALVISIIAIIK